MLSYYSASPTPPSPSPSSREEKGKKNTKKAVEYIVIGAAVVAFLAILYFAFRSKK